MLTYEIIVKYETQNSYPQISWKQDTEPYELEILKTLECLAKNHNIPKKYLEDKSVVFVDFEENGMYSAPDIYMIDFTRLKPE